jgi:U3 small nucleolar RNA-associated protein 25
MAKFKSSKHDKKKNKGPKGKKARMKMKLDRQWGEVEDPTKDRRKAPARAAVTTTTDRVKHFKGDALVQNIKTNENVDSEEMEKSLLSSDEDDTTTTKPVPFTKLLQRIQQQEGRSSRVSAISSQFSEQDSDDDNDMMDHESPLRRQSSLAPDEIGPMHLKDEDTIPVPMLKDQFMERFIQNCQPLDDSAINAASAQLLPLAKIQDNPNLYIQLSQSLMDHWYFGTMCQKASSQHQNDPSKKEESSDPIISKSRVRQTAQLCVQQLAYGPTLRIPSSLFRHVVPSLLLPAVTSYADVCVTTDGTDFGATNVNDDRSILERMNAMHTVTAVHILNHVLSSRQEIQQHNQRLSKQEQSRAKTKTSKDDGIRLAVEDEEWKKDQGYTRPTVLVLLPTRHCCYDYVQILLSLLYDTDGAELPPMTDFAPVVDNAERFTLEYGPPDPKDADRSPLEQRQQRQRVLRQKGTLWNELFGDHRNDDDDFKIGLQVNLSKKNKSAVTTSSAETSESFSGTVKLYSDFYRSDILLASPLGLKMTVASRSQEEEEDDDDDGDASQGPPGRTDFLSSIEICFLARADVLLQQNWDHVTDVLRLLNPLPKSMNDTDFSRVRPYFLADQAKYWRQLILSSRHADPFMTSALKRYASGQGGIVHIKRKWDVEESSLQAVRWPGTKQVFQRVPTTASFASAGTDRVQYFLRHIWPELERQKQAHTLVFIPSYFDFVALRNILLQRQNDGVARIDFVSVTEYARVSEVSRGRARFLQGRKEVLLYTGRAHFFLRHAIKGVRHLIFLGLPEDASFYAEHVNRLNGGWSPSSFASSEAPESSHSCVALFTKYDSYALERIVGSANCRRMLQGESSTFSFTS